MTPNLHSVLFRDTDRYWIPETFGQDAPFRELETTLYKKVTNARAQILEAMREIGSRCTTSEIVAKSGGALYINLVNRHLEKMKLEGIVKHSGWASINPKGGQRSRLWAIR